MYCFAPIETEPTHVTYPISAVLRYHHRRRVHMISRVILPRHGMQSRKWRGETIENGKKGKGEFRCVCARSCGRVAGTHVILGIYFARSQSVRVVYKLLFDRVYHACE